MNRKLIFNSSVLVTLLVIYLFGILVWDYTWVYRIALVLLLIVFLIVRKGKVAVAHRPFFLTSFLLFIYFVSHTLLGFSKNNALSKSYLVTLFINLVAILLCENIIDSEKTLERIMRSWIIISFLMSLYIIIMDRSNLFSGNLGSHVTKPFTSSLYSHNDIALIAAFAIAFIGYFVNKKTIPKSSVIIQLFFLVFIILTGARKSLLIAMAGFILYPLIFNGKRGPKKWVNVAIACIGVVAMFYLVLNNELLYRLIGNRFAGYFSGLSGGSFTESSALTRSVMRETAWRAIREKPFWGWGLNTFRTFPGSYGTWSHVNYLELWVSGGVIPVVIYYSFYGYAVFNLIKKRHNTNTSLNGLFLMLMFCMVIMDYLSVTYVSRMIGFIYCMVDAYIFHGLNKQASENGVKQND